MIDKITTDGSIRLPVLVCVLQTDGIASFQLHAARALNLEREGIEGTVNPHELPATQCGIGWQLRAAVVGDDAISVDEPATDRFTFELRIDCGQIDSEEVRRWRINRGVELRGRSASAPQQRLVIARD